MRFVLATALLFALTTTAKAEEVKPYGWTQCTTTFAGNIDRCLEFVANPCTSQEQDPCLANYAKSWFAFAVNRMLRQSLAPASSGKRTDLKRLNGSFSTVGSFTEDCAKDDVECIFNSIITNVLKEHGRKVNAQ